MFSAILVFNTAIQSEPTIWGYLTLHFLLARREYDSTAYRMSSLKLVLELEHVLEQRHPSDNKRILLISCTGSVHVKITGFDV